MVRPEFSSSSSATVSTTRQAPSTSVVSTFAKCDIIDFTSQADNSSVQTVLYLKSISKIACFHQNGLITLYEADTHYPVKTFKAHSGAITASCFDGKKKRLITQYIGEIKIWDLTTIRFTQVSVINLEISIANSLEVFKKKNTLVVAGEYKCWKKPNQFDTMFLVDIETKDVLSTWKDWAVVQSTQKVRFGKGRYLLACGFSNGYLKLFSCDKKFNCIRIVKAHQTKINKLHVTRINQHPFCLTESDDKRIRLWNINSQLTALRTWNFPQKTIIGGTYYNHKVMILFQGTQVIFVNLIKGNMFKRVDVGVSGIARGLTFGRQPKVLAVLDINKLSFLGIKN